MFLLILSLKCIGQSKAAVNAIVDKTRILIGEHIQLQLEANIPVKEPIRFFSVDSLPHFEILEEQKIDTVQTESGIFLKQKIIITSFDSGHWVIQPFLLSKNIKTDSIPIDVVFSVFDPESNYHDVKGIIEVDSKKIKKRWWFFIAGAVALILIVLFILLRRKKSFSNKEQILQTDPFDEAMKSLAGIHRDQLTEKEYYSRVVDIFRLYVLRRKGIMSLQKTTEDLVFQLKKIGLAGEQFSDLSSSLRLSDYVKFAKYIPTEDDNKAFFKTIKKSIEYIERIK